MPQCRRDQRRFAQFLLALVVIESLLVYIAMTREHKYAEMVAMGKRRKLRWQREVERRGAQARAEERRTAFNLVRGKDFGSNLHHFGFSLKKLEEEIRDEKEAFISKSEDFAEGRIHPRSLDAHLVVSKGQALGENNMRREDVNDDGKVEDISRLNGLRENSGEEKKTFSIMDFLRSSINGPGNDEFQNKRMSVRGSML